MKNLKLIHQIAGKLVVEGLTHDFVTKEKAISKTSNCDSSILIHQEIERNYDEIVLAMSQMTLN